VHMGCGIGDQDIVRAWKEHLLPVVKNFKPGLVMISAGFDSRKDDPLGCFAVTDHGFHLLSKMAMEIAHEYSSDRLVSVLEGGYNVNGLADAVYTHIRTLAGKI
jgi:acetoin utilization deacetylase AcuC-like enzyme